MRTPSISKDDVFKIASELRQAGQLPSVRSILSIHGRGSFTTIARHLAAWKAENQVGQDVQLPRDLPKYVVTALNQFVDDSVRASNEALLDRLEQAELVVADSAREIASLESQCSSLEERALSAERALLEHQVRSEFLNRELDKAREATLLSERSRAVLSAENSRLTKLLQHQEELLARTVRA